MNNLLLSLFGPIREKLHGLIPSRIKRTISHGKNFKEKKTNQFEKKILSLRGKFSHNLGHYGERAKKLKGKSIGFISQVKKADVKNIDYRRSLLALAALISPLLIKLKVWYLGLKPSTIVTFVSLSTIGTLTSLNIYVQSNKIQNESSRPPAAELVDEVERATEVSRRPAYFKKGEKQFKITNIVLPSDLQNDGPLKKLVIDFTFESSNKYIKQYLWRNPHLIQDALNSKIEPIAIGFPLTNEGKAVVKEKIKKEMNALLEKLHIKGKIKEVYIHSLIAG